MRDFFYFSFSAGEMDGGVTAYANLFVISRLFSFFFS